MASSFFHGAGENNDKLYGDSVNVGMFWQGGPNQVSAVTCDQATETEIWDRLTAHFHVTGLNFGDLIDIVAEVEFDLDVAASCAFEPPGCFDPPPLAQPPIWRSSDDVGGPVP